MADERLRSAAKKLLAASDVSETLDNADRIEKLRGTAAWLNKRDDIPDGAFVRLDHLLELRRALEAPP